MKNTATRANLNTQQLMIECSFDCKQKHSFCALQFHHHFLETSMPSFEITITLKIDSVIRDSSKAEVKEKFRTDAIGVKNVCKGHNNISKDIRFLNRLIL